RYSGKNNGLTVVVRRITMVALTEEESVRGAVRDVGQANAAVDPEDAVPRYVGKIKRPRAGVAAITAHPVGTPGPLRTALSCGFHDGFRQRIRRAEQELDDMSRGGIPVSNDVVAVIAVVPLLMQVVLFEEGEQLDPQVGAPGRTVAN